MQNQITHLGSFSDLKSNALRLGDTLLLYADDMRDFNGEPWECQAWLTPDPSDYTQNGEAEPFPLAYDKEREDLFRRSGINSNNGNMSLSAEIDTREWLERDTKYWAVFEFTLGVRKILEVTTFYIAGDVTAQ